jgi:hypothetical protein
MDGSEDGHATASEIGAACSYSPHLIPSILLSMAVPEHRTRPVEKRRRLSFQYLGGLYLHLLLESLLDRSRTHTEGLA